MLLRVLSVAMCRTDFEIWSGTRDGLLSRPEGDSIMQTACGPMDRSSRVFAVSAKRQSAGTLVPSFNSYTQEPVSGCTQSTIYDKFGRISNCGQILTKKLEIYSGFSEHARSGTVLQTLKICLGGPVHRPLNGHFGWLLASVQSINQWAKPCA